MKNANRKTLAKMPKCRFEKESQVEALLGYLKKNHQGARDLEFVEFSNYHLEFVENSIYYKILSIL